MEKESYQERQLYREQKARQEAAAPGGPGVCANCGATVAPGAAFCEECGAPQGGHVCVSCGSTVDPGVAICPHCGHPATTRCTFCGAEMSAGEAFCPECGNSRSGIVCPHCNTLNFRSFCRKCNTPLNPMALYAIEQAKADPRYQRACAIAEQLADMEDEMERLQTLIAQEQARAAEPLLQVDDRVSEETRRLLDEFERLSREASPVKKRPQTPAAPRVESAPKPAEFKIEASAPKSGDVGVGGFRGGVSDASARLEELRSQYREKLADFQKEIDAMIPDPADPPEIQRNFACAHMITTRTTTYRKEKQRIAWVCNRCHIFHNNPSECGVAEFGGKWVTKEITVAVESSSTGSVNI